MHVTSEDDHTIHRLMRINTRYGHNQLLGLKIKFVNGSVMWYHLHISDQFEL